MRSHADTPDQLTPIITGPATRAYRITYEPGDQWFGIRLRPEQNATLWQGDLEHAADRVLRGPAALNRFPSLSKLQGNPLTQATLAQVIPSQLWPTIDPRLTRALDILHTSGGRLRVKALAKFVACGDRHLNRLFRRHVGLPTKTYAQLVQFHRSLRLLTTGKVSIISAAYEGGYSDHAHMTRSFRRFGGFTPNSIPCDLALPNLFQT